MKLFKYILGTTIGAAMFIFTVVSRLHTPEGLNLLYVIACLAGLGMFVMYFNRVIEELKRTRRF